MGNIAGLKKVLKNRLHNHCPKNVTYHVNKITVILRFQLNVFVKMWTRVNNIV